MNVTGAWKFRVSNRSLALIIPLVTLLVASVFWNLRQHRLIEQERMQAVRNERKLPVPRRKPSGQRHVGKRTPSGLRRMRVYSNCIGRSTISARLTNGSSRSPSRARRRRSEDPGDADGLP